MMARFMSCKSVSFRSRSIPRILGRFVGSVQLLNLSNRVVTYSAGSDVKNVVVVLSVKIISIGSFIDFVKIWLNELLGLIQSLM